jgi:hypothetical protein
MVHIVLALASRKLPKPPLQTIGPIDEVEMADTNQCALVDTPLARLYAGETSGWRTCGHKDEYLT